MNRWPMLMMLLPLMLPAACKHDDMADQNKPKAFGASSYFANGAASRVPPDHTVPIDASLTEDPDNQFWLSPSTATHFPFPITRADLLRGKECFEVDCTACHGMLGDGNGMVPQRGFVRPPSFHTDRLRNAPPSYFYDVITKGIGDMFSYADRVKPDDRWRIAAYIRALQLAEHAPANAASTETGGRP
jgi:mono/diheme cytochrome c family protein